MEKGLLKNGNEDVRELIIQGMDHMKSFYKDGLFSLWERGIPDGEISAQVLRNLVPLHDGSPDGRGFFRDFRPVVDSVAQTLLRKKLRDNRLVPYNREFAGEMVTVRDAAILHQAGINKSRALDLVLNRAVVDEDRALWKDESCWAKETEAICYALQVLHRERREELFRKGLNFLSGRIINGMLYSTSDTCAFIELLMSMEGCPEPCAIVDGKEVHLKEAISCAAVEAVDELLVRIDRDEEIDYLSPGNTFDARLKVDKKSLSRGEKGMLEIVPLEKMIAPLARIYMPGNCASLTGGGAAQKLYLPMENGSLRMEFYGVRRGKGAIRAVIHDMYDSGKICVLPGEVIEVH